MFTIIFFIILSLVTIINNKMQDISNENTNAYKFDKNSIIIIISLLGISLILNILREKMINILITIIIIYSVLCFFFFMVANSMKVQAIKKEREQIKNIFEVLKTLLKMDQIDYDNIPFEIHYSKTNKSQIEEIVVNMENPDRFVDASITQAIYNLNKFLPYRRWTSSTDFPERKCIFIGKRLPPEVAKFPGSDLRPWNWIPVGLGGEGELGWNLGASKENMGRSLYIYEDTKLPAGTTNVSKAPQCITVGATGGGKAIWLEQEVDLQ